MGNAAHSRRRASAPASSANLGPGFDVVALALGRRCTVTVEAAGEWSLTSAGADEGSVALLRRAAALAAPAAGPCAVTVESEIPVGKGLGSSAALAAGMVAALLTVAGRSVEREEVFRLAAELEGHPDNAAAAVYGGGVAVGPGGRVAPLDVHPAWRLLVAIPATTLSTAAARAALRAPVPTALAARTAGRLAFLVEGLRRGDPGLLAEAAGDELHEQRRRRLSPLTGRLVEAARAAGAAHAAWSGAGPAALAVVTTETAAAVRRAWEGLVGAGGEVWEPGIDRQGLLWDQVGDS